MTFAGTLTNCIDSVSRGSHRHGELFSQALMLALYEETRAGTLTNCIDSTSRSCHCHCWPFSQALMLAL